MARKPTRPPVVLVALVCLQCGSDFQRTPWDVKRGRTRFCSKPCFHQWNVAHPETNPRVSRLTKQCPVCGKGFTVPPKRADKSKINYCSKACFFKAKNKGEIRLCETCGAEFYAPRVRSQMGQARFCSLKCRGPENAERNRQRIWAEESKRKASAAKLGKPVQALRKPPIVITCLNCGKQASFELRRRPSKGRLPKFCGGQCRWEYARKHPESNPNFRGGRYPYYGPNFPHQARAARDRDGHTCQGCGMTEGELGRKLDVHHIKPRRDFSGDWRSANHLDNLISYCKACHQRAESALLQR